MGIPDEDVARVRAATDIVALIGEHAALKRVGCKDVELTVFPEAGHDSWTEAYANPKLYDWFLQHSRKTR